MCLKQVRKTYGFTLIEVIVAALVIVLAVIGAIAFRYHCALDSRKAAVQITAARSGLMLLESWRGFGGRSSADPFNLFDPVNLSFAGSELLVTSDVGPDVTSGYNSFGSYRLVVDGAYYYATISFKDEPANDLRILSVSVAWPEDYPVGTYSGSDKSVTITTKVNLPG